MPNADTVLARLREICLALPNTKETATWGQPHFRVGDKIFAGFGEEGGQHAIGFKLTPEHAAAMVKDARFWPAKYGGHRGWVSMDAFAVTNWEELQALIHESYRLIAPKRVVALMESSAANVTSNPAPKKRTTTRAAAKKRVSRKTK